MKTIGSKVKVEIMKTSQTYKKGQVLEGKVLRSGKSKIYGKFTVVRVNCGTLFTIADNPEVSMIDENSRIIN